MPRVAAYRRRALPIKNRRSGLVDRFRLGVDIGGTFTDFALLNETTGAVEILKIPTSPRAPAAAVTDGFRRFRPGR
jgi:hypothetical protein